VSAREPLRRFASAALALPLDDVDTDRIVPARFLKGTDRAGLADALFADERRDAQGAPRADFSLNRPDAQARSILIAGRNFGCGSSREHAVWALRAFGFRAVIAPSFADIFRANALENGLVPIEVDAATHARALDCARAGADATFVVDVAEGRLVLPDDSEVAFAIEPLARRCLIEGTDTLGVLLGHLADIDRYEAENPAPVRTDATAAMEPAS
jgi:3-isopropylmalate/(R)-2-methylmalate dehydratase small subunit